MKRAALGVAALVLFAGGLIALRLLHPAPAAAPIAVAPLPVAAPIVDAGLELAVAVEEPKGPRVCVRARSRAVAGAEVAYADQAVRTGDDGCVELPPPNGRALDVCARSSAGAVCAHATAVADGAWLPITLELSSSGKLRVEVVNLRGQPVSDAEVTVTTSNVGWRERTSNGGVAIVDHLPVGRASVSAVARGYAGTDHAEAEVPASDQARVRLTLERAAAVAGVVLDPTDARAGSVELEAVSATSNGLFTPSELSDGGFRFDSLAAGPYDLRVHAPGFARTIAEVTAPDERVIVKLEPGFPLDVQVDGSNGRPIEAVVVIESASEHRFFRVEGRTGAAGHARFDDLPAGDVEVTFGAAEEADEPCHTLARAHARVDAEHQSLALHVERGLEISGKLVDARGKPIKGEVLATRTNAPVFDELRHHEGGAHAKTGSNGAFSLRCLQRGAYRLEASAESHTGADAIIPSVNAGTSGLTLTCHTPAHVVGLVICPDRKPCARFNLNGFAARSTEGHFDEELSSAGPKDFVFSAKGAAPVSVHVEVREGERTDLGTVSLQRAQQIRGRVVDASNHVGVAGAAIAAPRDGGVPFDTVNSGPLGDFSVDAPQGASLVVRVTAKDYRPETFQLTDGADLALGAGASLRGKVLDRRGDPMIGARVFARGEHDARVAKTEPDGSFSLRGLEPGDWSLSVSNKAGANVDVPLTVVHVPEDGLNDLVLRQRSGGADLVVDVGFESRDLIEATLVPGESPAPTTSSQLKELIGRALCTGHRVRTTYRFDAVPEGTYTFVLFRLGADGSSPVAYAHTEKIVVSGNGLMRWTAHVHGAYLEIDSDLWK